MSEHTPPWYIWPDATDATIIATVPWPGGDTKFAKQHEVLGISEWIRLDDEALALIVRAVNAHAGLVEACELLMAGAHWDGAPQADLVDYGVYDAIEAALKAAKGEP